jgi:ferritin-like metal-binding protein YciE
MFKNSSLLSGTQTWSIAAVFVATIALVGFTNPSGPSLGVLTEPKTRDAEKLFDMQIREMLYVEERMTVKLGELLNMAKTPSLRQALEQHRKETASQADRLKRIMGVTGEMRMDTRSAGYDGINTDNDKMMAEFKDTPLADQVLIAGCRRVEHFEMSCYMNLLATAKIAGKDEYVPLLEESLREEQSADQTLNKLLQEAQDKPDGARERKPATETAPVQKQIPNKR